MNQFSNARAKDTPVDLSEHKIKNCAEAISKHQDFLVKLKAVDLQTYTYAQPAGPTAFVVYYNFHYDKLKLYF